MVIHLGQDLDHHNAVYIREMADSYVDKYPIDRIIFDFSGVEFMDSSGIGVVMGRYDSEPSLKPVFLWCCSCPSPSPMALTNGLLPPLA